MNSRNGNLQVVLCAMANIGHAPHLAIGLQKAGILKKWYTGIYKDPKKSYFLSKLFPRINHRYKGTVNKDIVNEYIATEILIRGISRMFFSGEHSGKKLYLLTHSFFRNAVCREILKNPPDIVVGLDMMSLEIFKALKKRKIGTTLFSLRSAHPFDLRMAYRLEYAKRGADMELFSKNIFFNDYVIDIFQKELQLSDYILCPSRFVINSAKANNIPEKSLIYLPYGVDAKIPTINKMNKKKDKFRVLYVGRVTLMKGLHYLIEAFKRIKIKNIELIIVGKLSNDSKYLPSLSKNIKFFSWMPPDRLQMFYNSADIFIIPSLIEGSSRVGFEAMAAGLPTIATDRCGIPIKDGSNGLIIPACNTKAIEDSVVKLYENNQLRQTVGYNAKLTMSEYTWRRYYDGIKNVCGKLHAKS